MRILAVGDIVGKAGIQKLKDCLPKIIEDNMIDFVIVNGENAADGMGLTEKQYRDILSLNVNVVTMGNHTWGKKEIFNYINENQIIRPANYSPNNPGHGYGIFECKGKKICVINLIGRTGMAVLTDNPFLKAKEIINEVKDKVDIIGAFEAKITSNLSGKKASPSPTVKEEVLEALVALGYSASNAARALDKMTITESTTTEQLLSDTLKQMSFL